jgi:hypothetical protein
MHTDTPLSRWMDDIPPGETIFFTFWHEPGPLFRLWMQRTRIRTLTRHRYRARKARR